ncbi:MAG: hypothetical protein ACRYFY_03730, partial [Janthinobacterium lividum]
GPSKMRWLRGEYMMRVSKIGMLVVFAGLAACSIQPVEKTAAGINWSIAPVARLRLEVGFFHPQHLNLALNQPVRLIFDNGGGATHDFVTGFFASVAQRPAGQATAGQMPGGQLLGKQVAGARVILQPAETVEYDIVPLTPGRYVVQTVMASSVGSVPPATISVR